MAIMPLTRSQFLNVIYALARVQISPTPNCLFLLLLCLYPEPAVLNLSESAIPLRP